MSDNSCPMPPFSSIKRRTKKRPAVRVGHLGIVRLSGSALEQLRNDCFDRDRGRCQVCHELLYFYPRYADDPWAYDMAHIVSRGAGGSDELSNVKSLCHKDHMLEHTKGSK